MPIYQVNRPLPVKVVVVGESKKCGTAKHRSASGRDEMRVACTDSSRLKVSTDLWL